jgi:hypothetical protein
MVLLANGKARNDNANAIIPLTAMVQTENG